MKKRGTTLTDPQRDNIIKLKNCSNPKLKNSEIADILDVSKSIVGYVLQSYKAVFEKDDDKIKYLYTHGQRISILWASKKLNYDITFVADTNTENATDEIQSRIDVPIHNEPEDVKLSDVQRNLLEIKYILNEILKILE